MSLFRRYIYRGTSNTGGVWKKPRFLSTIDTVSMEHYLLIGMSAIQGLWDCRIIECIVLVRIQGFVFPRFRIPYCNVAAKSDIDLIQICRSSAAIVCGSSNKQHDVRRIKVCASKRKTHCVHWYKYDSLERGQSRTEILAPVPCRLMSKASTY